MSVLSCGETEHQHNMKYEEADDHPDEFRCCNCREWFPMELLEEFCNDDYCHDCHQEMLMNTTIETTEE